MTRRAVVFAYHNVGVRCLRVLAARGIQVELVVTHEVSWHWVKGHAGHPGNERADALANKGVELARQAARA